MQVSKVDIAGILVFKPKVFTDDRGFFLESWNQRTFKDTTGLDVNFVQDNHSRSEKGVLRGLHYQLNNPQGKLVWVARGRVLDVAVDLRRPSKTFGQYYAIELSDKNHKQLWIPPGFAHGFAVLSETADFLYKTTDYYTPSDEHCINWSDPDINIDWHLRETQPQISQKDRAGVAFREAETYP